MRPSCRNDISRNDRSWKPSWPDFRTVGVRQARPPPLAESRRTLVAGPRGAQSCRSLPVNCPPLQWKLRKEDLCPGCWKIWRPGFGDRRPAANGKAPRLGRVANHVSFRLPAVSLEILWKGRLQVLLIDSNYGMRSLPLKNMSTHWRQPCFNSSIGSVVEPHQRFIAVPVPTLENLGSVSGSSSRIQTYFNNNFTQNLAFSMWSSIV